MSCCIYMLTRVLLLLLQRSFLRMSLQSRFNGLHSSTCPRREHVLWDSNRYFRDSNIKRPNYTNMLMVLTGKGLDPITDIKAKNSMNSYTIYTVC